MMLTSYFGMCILISLCNFRNALMSSNIKVKSGRAKKSQPVSTFNILMILGSRGKCIQTSSSTRHEQETFFVTKAYFIA